MTTGLRTGPRSRLGARLLPLGRRGEGARLEGANLVDAHLEGARLVDAHLEGAELGGAHLEGADLRRAEGLTQAQLNAAHGDAATKIPEGLDRPAYWPPSPVSP